MVFSFVDYTPAYYGDYVFPPAAEAVGWLVALSAVVVVIVYAIIYLCLQEGTLLQVRETTK